ncbi:MAG: hypothetical protein IJA75_02770 [Oscillospiraceae bacterium]|nr:hypothetical protein [Oscillospiraceae bacterium]
MFNIKWLDLQLFAGTGDGGEGAQTGESAADPGQQRLLELGVPADKLRKRANKKAPRLTNGAVKTAPKQPESRQDAAADPTEGTESRMTWDEIVADPEYNAQMQRMVQSRLKEAKGAEENLGKLAPMLELLARKHGMDPEKLDYDALARAVSQDAALSEHRQDAAQNPAQQSFRDHIRRLEEQGQAMKQMFPEFDLRKELQNPAFARMTAPGVGISVEDAYHALHRKEILSAAGQVIAQRTAQKVSNAIRSGSIRPSENGTSGQAPSVTTFDYSKASPEQRAALKAYIRAEAAQGRKVHPGAYPGRG